MAVCASCHCEIGEVHLCNITYSQYFEGLEERNQRIVQKYGAPDYAKPPQEYIQGGLFIIKVTQIGEVVPLPGVEI